MTIKTVRNLRRISQIMFFVLFFFLILKTTFEVSLSPEDTGVIELPYPVSWLLELDPLAALVTMLSSGTLYRGLLWALVIVIPTILFGRFFCGWMCPLGTLNHWLSEWRSKRPSRRGKARVRSNAYHPYQKVKFGILIGVLAAAFAGSALAGWFDPLCFFARSIGTVVIPVLHEGAQSARDWVHSWGLPPTSWLADVLYTALAWVALPFRKATYQSVLFLGIIFLIVLGANRLITRFWCRGICPLGALLGLLSRFAIFGLQKDPASCTHCKQCTLSCQGGDNPEPGQVWHQEECHLCFNCQASCPEGSLSFKFFPNRQERPDNPAPISGPRLNRRQLLMAAAGGFIAVPAMRTGVTAPNRPVPSRIRPPGALPEEEFLARCIRCGQCMRVCPNNALHPTFIKAGLEGMWTPVVVPKIGYCEPTCTLCGQVCPTGAIVELSLVQKVGDAEKPPTRLGTAFIDRGRCLPWAMNRPCIVCEEWCPTSPKSIVLETVELADANGIPYTVQRPRIDPKHCTGCGACEYACPVQDKSAIRISSVGESRSVDNQLLLRKMTTKQKT